MFKKALLPLDITETETEIVSKANYIKQLGIKYLRLLHVSSPGAGNNEKIMDRLNNLGVLLHSFGYGITVEVREGYPPTEICGAAAREDIDLIFLPWRRKSKAYRTLLGSTAQEVVRLTDQPVFIYKDMPEYGEQNIDIVLYPTDLKGAAAGVVPYVKVFGEKASKLILLHVGRRAADPVSEEKRQREVRERMVELERIFSPGFKHVESHFGLGTPHSNILEQAKESKVDLIVMGRFTKTPLNKIMGSTSVKVVDHARCSIMVIP